jgi:hypothetical protein
MTGRSLHDALLRALTSARLRQRLAAGDDDAVPAEEAGILRAADGDRLARLARFMGRHFYRERIVRLFAASRALARARRIDPLRVLESPAFAALLDRAELGSAVTADGVARLVEADLGGALAALPYAADLIAYEGAFFRAEAGPRRWRETADGADGHPIRSVHARVCVFAWDVTGLVAAVRRGDATLPDPPPLATRLLVSLSPSGRVTTLRCPEPVERLLSALDGTRSPAEAAAAAGVAEADATRVLRQLVDVGAVEWRVPGATSPRSSSRSSGTE